jgi:hypothetical protein
MSESDERITLDEIRDIFGATMPIEAAQILGSGLFSPAAARLKLREIADRRPSPSDATERVRPFHKEDVRQIVKAFFELAGKVDEALGGLPHRDAVPALRSLQQMMDIVGEQLPGGYCGDCPHCDEVKGEDEMEYCGEERVCSACIARWNESPTPDAGASDGTE